MENMFVIVGNPLNPELSDQNACDPGQRCANIYFHVAGFKSSRVIVKHFVAGFQASRVQRVNVVEQPNMLHCLYGLEFYLSTSSAVAHEMKLID